jgi:hypothetical protein
MKKECKICAQVYEAGWLGRRKCVRCEAKSVNSFLDANGKKRPLNSIPVSKLGLDEAHRSYNPTNDLMSPLNPFSPVSQLNNSLLNNGLEPVDTSHHSSPSHNYATSANCPEIPDSSFSTSDCSPSSDTSFTSDFGGGDISGNY